MALVKMRGPSYASARWQAAKLGTRFDALLNGEHAPQKASQHLLTVAADGFEHVCTTLRARRRSGCQWTAREFAIALSGIELLVNVVEGAR